LENKKEKYIKKLRKRIEDNIRKCENIEILVFIGKYLGVKVPRDLE